VLSKLKEKQEEFQKRGVEMLIQEDPFCVAVVTPIMRRGHSLLGISDIVPR
jgi:hypothetical protein